MLKSPHRAVKKAAFYFVKKRDNRSINWLDNDQIRQGLSASASFLISGSVVIHDLFQCSRNADVRRMMRPSGNANSANKTFSSYFCADLYKRTAICAIIRMPQPVWRRLPCCLTPRAKGWHVKMKWYRFRIGSCSLAVSKLVGVKGGYHGDCCKEISFAWQWNQY